jgi:hypothetical protein
MNEAYLSPDFSTNPSRPRSIQDLVRQFTQLWWDCQSELPDLGRTYTLDEQRQAERSYEGYLQTLNETFRNMPATGPRRQEAQRRVQNASIRFARSTLGFEERHIQALQAYGFTGIAAEFAARAQDFDPALGDQEIYQACRNVWSMNLMQLLLRRPIELTPAVFGYSLLYPYTDNYLDDPTIPRAEKEAFNRRFSARLAGEHVTPADPKEEKISELVRMIENQFDRSRYPDVYQSLFAIHRAQSKSVNLLRDNSSPFEVDILGICFEKGGTSVLADGYLVKGTLTQAEQTLMFHYGTLTQLVDDLEDLEQDLVNGLMTVFSATAGRWPLEPVTNRTMQFAGKAMEALDEFDAPAAEPLKALIHRSITPLLIGEIGSAGKYLSPAYLRTLEPHSPFRFSFIRKQRKKLSTQRLSLVGLVQALAVPIP